MLNRLLPLIIVLLLVIVGYTFLNNQNIGDDLSSVPVATETSVGEDVGVEVVLAEIGESGEFGIATLTQQGGQVLCLFL